MHAYVYTSVFVIRGVYNVKFTITRYNLKRLAPYINWHNSTLHTNKPFKIYYHRNKDGYGETKTNAPEYNLNS